MTLDECLPKMIAPGQLRPSKPYRGGVVQILVTRACDKSCYGCTQGSNLGGPVEFMSPTHFEQAVRSLGFRDGYGTSKLAATGFLPTDAYFGVVGVFGGNPALSPHFGAYCDILKELVPFDQRGLWCNHPKGKGLLMRETFNPRYSNINVHLDRAAYDEFRRDWPEVGPVGLTTDSRHSPVHLAAKDVVLKECVCLYRVAGDLFPVKNCPNCGGTGRVPDYDRIWDAVSTCDINQNWSAMIGVFRGELRAWFCEVAGAQAMLHQHEPDYPDTGVPIHVWDNLPGSGQNVTAVDNTWWREPISSFRNQVEKHCPECAVPLRGYGELSQAEDGVELTSKTHAGVFKPKRKGRKVQVVTDLVQLGTGRIEHVNHYLQNSTR